MVAERGGWWLTLLERLGFAAPPHAELNRRGRIEFLEAQHAVLKLIAAGRPLAQSLQHLCHLIEHLDPPALCSVVLLQDEKYLRALAAPSLPDAYSSAIDGLPIGPKAGSCGTAMWRRSTVVVSDIDRDPLWVDYVHLTKVHGLRACWSKPILGAAGQVLGSFALYYRAPRAPSIRSHEIMDVATELAAVAIERALLDEQLSISRARYELAQRVAKLALWQFDFKTGQTYWSPEFRSMLDMPQDAQPSRELGYSRVTDSDRQRLIATHDEAQRSGRGYEIQYQIRWLDGSVRYLSERGGVTRAADGSVRSLAAALQDETLRHDATVKLAALAYATQKLNAQYSLQQLLTFIANSARELADVRIAYVSVGWNDATAAECAANLPDAERKLLAARLQQHLQATADQPQPQRYASGQSDNPLLSRGGWSMPLYGRDGAVLGFLAVLDKVDGDFTEFDERLLRQLGDVAAIGIENVRLYADLEARVSERTIELERSNRELEAFSYTVSHDLRSPLRAIAGFAGLLTLEHTAQLDTSAREYLQRIGAATERMTDLIDALLGLGKVRKAPLSRVSVNLSSLAAKCAAQVAEQFPNRQVQLEITPGLTAAADARLMEIVLTNLFDNAWKFTRDQPQARVTAGAEFQHGEQVFFVADNGAGFDPRHAEQLFGVFQRLHTDEEFPGTGIGLATVQRIIERHGGRVFASGVPGGGAKIFFTLPSR